MSRVYLDTSVLLSIYVLQHENNSAAKSLLVNCIKNGIGVTTAMHTYAELFRNLTRNRPPYELSAKDFQRAVIDQSSKILEVISTNEEDYEAAIQRCVDLKLQGAVIYDALHLQAALKAGAQTLYTDNLRDFTRLVTPADPIEIKGIR